MSNVRRAKNICEIRIQIRSDKETLSNTRNGTVYMKFWQEEERIGKKKWPEIKCCG